MPSTGTTVGLGRTRRQGLDLQATLRASEQLRLWASHSLQEARVVQAYTASGVSLAGKEVFSTPRHISNLGIEYSPDAQWRLTLQGRAQGSHYIDDLNAQGKHGAHVLFDLSVRRALEPCQPGPAGAQPGRPPACLHLVRQLLLALGQRTADELAGRPPLGDAGPQPQDVRIGPGATGAVVFASSPPGHQLVTGCVLCDLSALPCPSL